MGQPSIRILSRPTTAGRGAPLHCRNTNTRAMDLFDVVEFDSLNEPVQNLIKQATEVRTNAYCPYSNFPVGCAIVTEKDSKIYTGCNVESVSHTPCVCAERVAVCKAVSEGYLHIQTAAIVAHQDDQFTSPCGVCRQVLNEFKGSNGDMDVFLSKPAMEYVLCTKLSKLLPLTFNIKR